MVKYTVRNVTHFIIYKASYNSLVPFLQQHLCLYVQSAPLSGHAALKVGFPPKNKMVAGPVPFRKQRNMLIVKAF